MFWSQFMLKICVSLYSLLPVSTYLRWHFLFQLASNFWELDMSHMELLEKFSLAEARTHIPTHAWSPSPNFERQELPPDIYLRVDCQLSSSKQVNWSYQYNLAFMPTFVPTSLDWLFLMTSHRFCLNYHYRCRLEQINLSSTIAAISLGPSSASGALDHKKCRLDSLRYCAFSWPASAVLRCISPIATST
jgi:hypothetical protein